MMKTEDIKTISDAQRYVEGCVNDYEAGISSKEELISHLGEYTCAIMEKFSNRLEAAFLAGRSKQSWESFKTDF